MGPTFNFAADRSGNPLSGLLSGGAGGAARNAGKPMSEKPKRTCALCKTNRPALKRPKTGQSICRECFYFVFEQEIHETITSAGLFKKGQKVAIAASGGKGVLVYDHGAQLHKLNRFTEDSTVLAYVMKLLNDRHSYGLDLCLLSVDEGITGYRDDSLETVKRNEKQYGIPLKIVSYEELYGWSMDSIVAKIGKRNNCDLAIRG